MDKCHSMNCKKSLGQHLKTILFNLQMLWHPPFLTDYKADTWVYCTVYKKSKGRTPLIIDFKAIESGFTITTCHWWNNHTLPLMEFGDSLEITTPPCCLAPNLATNAKIPNSPPVRSGQQAEVERKGDLKYDRWHVNGLTPSHDVVPWLTLQR